MPIKIIIDDGAPIEHRREYNGIIFEFSKQVQDQLEFLRKLLHDDDLAGCSLLPPER